MDEIHKCLMPKHYSLAALSMRFTFTYHGNPMPRPRVARYGGIYVASEYMEYKTILAVLMNRERAGQDCWWMWPPSTNDKKARAKYLKDFRFRLSAVFYRTHNRGDIGNLVKAVEDALQDANIIGDDSQIDEYFEPFGKRIDKDNPRIEIILERVE